MEPAIDNRYRPITPAVGAVFEGVDLRRPPSAGLETIRQALLDHGVVFFRDQDDLTLDELATFVSNFRELDTDPLVGKPKERDQRQIKHGTATWHADFTYFPEPPVHTALRSVKLPPVGGDTCWTSLSAAYNALSEPVQRMLDGLTAVHSMTTTIGRLQALRSESDESANDYSAEAVHPVVTVHPESGRKALFVSETSTVQIVEMSSVESKHLLEMLFEHLNSPFFSMRWCWKPNDVALWDNRSVLHLAIPDYDEERVMQILRTTGQKPVGTLG